MVQVATLALTAPEVVGALAAADIAVLPAGYRRLGLSVAPSFAAGTLLETAQRCAGAITTGRPWGRCVLP